MQYRNDDNVKNTSYINKDFQALWEELLGLVPKLTNKWDPQNANESDPLAVLLKVLAIYSDKLNYNIDKSILERFPQTLTQLRSAHNVYDTLGYKAPWYKSATTNTINLSYQTGIPGKDEGSIVQGFTIPKFTMVSDVDSSIIYTLLDDVKFTEGPSIINVSSRAIEGVVRDYSINGVDIITANNLDSKNRLYFIEPNIAQNGIYISSNKDFTDLDEWSKVDNIFALNPDVSNRGKCYEFGVDPISGACYIEFPKNIGNLIGEGLYIKYIVSSGSNGNIKKNTLAQFSQDINVSDLKDLTEEISEDINTINGFIVINNPYAITNGTEPATIDEMYENYRKVRDTFDTLITLLDYENFLYLYENELGNNIISNIRVSDRSNDLYSSYKVRGINSSGEESIISKVTPLSNASPSMNAYSLRFYPLDASQNGVSDLNSFNSTFKQEIITQNTIDNAIANSKTILHDSMDNFGSPIFIDYDIIGDIYLNHKVSRYEAQNEIKPKIDEALFKLLNSREISFGKEISYKDVLNAIEGADDRIDYVALQPINYYKADLSPFPNHIPFVNGEIASDESAVSNSIIQRAMLAGVTPWANFNNQFNYNPMQSNPTYYPSSSDVTINNINSYISFSNENATRYKVENNEDFIMFAPQYQDKVIYSNYLYYIYISNDATTISANIPYTLGDNEDIYFYQTKKDVDTARDNNTWGNAGTSNYSAHLTKGDSIRPSFELKTTPAINSSSNANAYYSLNNGTSIAQIGYVGGALSQNSIQIITNSNGLVNALANNNEEYTLLTGEFLLFRNTNQASFTLLGEGNTLWSTTPITGINAQSDVDIENPKDVWSGPISGNILYYRQNQLYNFGVGYIFRYINASNASDANGNFSTWVNGLNNFTVQNSTPIDVSPIDNKQYHLQYQAPNSGDNWVNMPSLLANDTWKGFPRLSLNVSINSPYILTSVSNSDYVGHIQNLNILYSNGSNKDLNSSPNAELYVQSTLGISSPGGVEINFNASHPNIMTYKLQGNSSFVDNNIFTKISANEDWTVPGQNTEVAVYNIYSEEANGIISGVPTDGYKVYSMAVTGSCIFSPNKDVYVGRVKIAPSSTPYGISGNTLNDIASNTNILNLNAIYDEDFNPTYNILKADYMEDPTSPRAFLKQTHPLNRYVLPRLSNHVISVNGNYIDAFTATNGAESNSPLAGLKINELSINN